MKKSMITMFGVALAAESPATLSNFQSPLTRIPTRQSDDAMDIGGHGVTKSSSLRIEE